MEKNKSTDEEIMDALLAKYGVFVSTVSIDMDDWMDGSNDFWTQEVPNCVDEDCPCQEDN